MILQVMLCGEEEPSSFLSYLSTLNFHIIILLAFAAWAFLYPAIRSYNHALETRKYGFIVTGLIPIFNIHVLLKEKLIPQKIAVLSSIIYGILITILMSSIFFDFDELTFTNFHGAVMHRGIELFVIDSMIVIAYVVIAVRCVFHAIRIRRLEPAIIGFLPAINLVLNIGKKHVPDKLLVVITIVTGVALLAFIPLLFDNIFIQNEAKSLLEIFIQNQTESLEPSTFRQFSDYSGSAF